jgi:hypothetical protein
VDPLTGHLAMCAATHRDFARRARVRHERDHHTAAADHYDQLAALATVDPDAARDEYRTEAPFYQPVHA